MRKLTYLFLCILSAEAGLSQQRQLDSLRNLLQRHTADDTIKLRLLNEVGNAYCYIDAEKGFEVLNQAIILAGKLNNSDGLANAYHAKGICFYTKGDFKKSVVLQDSAFKLFKQINDKPGQVKALNRLGVDNIWLSQYPAALDYLQKALAMAREIDDKYGVATAIGNMGNLNNYMLRLEDAKGYYKESIDLYEEIGEKGRVAVILNNLGVVCLKTSQYSEAVEHNVKALKINQEMGIKKGIANNYLDLGRAYSGLKNYGIALDYLNKSLGLYEELGSKNNMVYSLRALADIYIQAPDSVFDNLNINKSIRYNKALEFQQLGLKLAQQTNHKDNISEAWKYLSKILEIKGDYFSALQAFKQHSTIRDSIAGDKTQQEVTRREVSFEYEKKEAITKATHTLELKQQRTLMYALLGGAVVLILGSVTIFFFYKKRRDAKAKQQEAELKAEITTTEMKALRAQMNPHFIFNSLNSISDYIARNNTELADEYLTKFGKLMRLVLENSEKKEVPLADDLQALELYLQLEAHRLNDKFNYEIIVDESIDKENTLIPPLILQPFVENSIWHGIAKKQGSGKIIISIKRENDMVSCVVEDDGIGRKQAAVETLQQEKGSMGMKITKERVAVLNKRKNANAVVNITDLATGTRVELKLPLELSF